MQKDGSSLWYYRRRYAAEVAKALGKLYFMKSLKTTVKREAERLSRRVSVEFDEICQRALLERDAAIAVADAVECEGDSMLMEQSLIDAKTAVNGIPELIGMAATRVVEEQQRDPRGWQDLIRRWRSLHEAMLIGAVPSAIQRPAVEAQAILNGIELAVQGKPVPSEYLAASKESATSPASITIEGKESWFSLCARALRVYKTKVGPARYKLAEANLNRITVETTTEQHIQEALRAWSEERLKLVQPRTVKSQLDGMASALRCVLPALETPYFRELKGVMQPRNTDRECIPLDIIRCALSTFNARILSNKVRKSYNGSASQFDAIAVEVLAVLGLRPRELMQAKTNALVIKTNPWGEQGIYFRVLEGKNKASERDIPLSDGSREVVNVAKLRAMLTWQEQNFRSPEGAVSSFGTRFRKATGIYTPYQMRHTWKDVALRANIDFEIRECLVGHSISGVATVYGSGIPLREGLDALEKIRSEVLQI